MAFMDFSVMAAFVSLILFLVGMLRFPQTSFQFIILMFVAAAIMWLAVSTNIQLMALQASPAPSANLISVEYDVAYLYDIVCIVFALMGVIMKLSESSI